VTAQGSMQQYVLRQCHGSHCQLPASYCQGPNSIPRQSVHNLWCKKWQWNRFFSECFDFPINILQLMMHTHSFIYHWCYIILATNSTAK